MEKMTMVWSFFLYNLYFLVGYNTVAFALLCFALPQQPCNIKRGV